MTIPKESVRIYSIRIYFKQSVNLNEAVLDKKNTVENTVCLGVLKEQKHNSLALFGYVIESTVVAISTDQNFTKQQQFSYPHIRRKHRRKMK